MIITKQKPLEVILDYIKGCKKIFLVGCELCATTCKTGGEEELKKMGKELQKEGKTIVGKVVLDPACNMLEVKRLYRKHSKEIEEADAILSFTCGGGTQAVAETMEESRVYPGSDTLFQGEITRSTLKERRFEQKCSLCGDCILAVTGGICPVTRCPKGLVNGPCGGIKDGKCEVDKDLECVWIVIYEKLKKLGKVEEMKVIREPKDHTKDKKPQDITVE